MPILTMNDPAFKDIGKYKVVTPDRVEEYTKAGWKLIAVVVPEPRSSEPDMKASMHPMFGPVAYYDRERGGRQNEYILGKDEMSVLAEANAQIAKTQQLVVEAAQRTETSNGTMRRIEHSYLTLLDKIRRCKTIEEAKAVVAAALKATKSES